MNVDLTKDKPTLNSRFNMLIDFIMAFGTEEDKAKWEEHLEENGYFDESKSWEWEEQWLMDRLEFGERLIP